MVSARSTVTAVSIGAPEWSTPRTRSVSRGSAGSGRTRYWLWALSMTGDMAIRAFAARAPQPLCRRFRPAPQGLPTAACYGLRVSTRGPNDADGRSLRSARGRPPWRRPAPVPDASRAISGRARACSRAPAGSGPTDAGGTGAAAVRFAACGCLVPQTRRTARTRSLPAPNLPPGPSSRIGGVHAQATREELTRSAHESPANRGPDSGFPQGYGTGRGTTGGRLGAAPSRGVRAGAGGAGGGGRARRFGEPNPQPAAAQASTQAPSACSALGGPLH